MTKAIHEMIDHITNPEHKWNESKYVFQATHSGLTDTDIKYSFTYTYQLGAAYMTGLFGSEQRGIKMSYVDNHGFQMVLTSAGPDGPVDSDPIFYPANSVVAIQRVKDFFDRWANR